MRIGWGYETGDLVTLQHCPGGYRLPEGLEPGEQIVLGQHDHGYWHCEKDGKRFAIAAPCVVPHPSQFVSHSLTQRPRAKMGSMDFDRDKVAAKAAELAKKGIYIGTSSWKYEGWLGQLYTADKYEYRGKLAKTRFEKACLTEYSEVFQTVCVDGAYYNFPSRQYLEGLSSQVGDSFKFGFKVTDVITIKKFPRLPRFGERAGQKNEHFLNADLFANAFLKPCESIRDKVGILMFEFSRFYPSDYQHGRDFIADLDVFFGNLPAGWPYGIELRNATWLNGEYFSVLKKHHVTHVFNSWDAMPSVTEQWALPGSVTTSERVAARFLLKPGRKYEEAVKAFSPYDKTKEVYREGRDIGAEILRASMRESRSAYIYVNNRFEGNALNTIAAMMSLPD